MLSKHKPNLGFLISGRGSNLKAILQKISEKKLKAEPLLVFSDKRDALGLEIAESYGVKTISFSPKQFADFTEYEENLVKTLKQNNVEWVVCAGYMRILKKTMLNAFPERIINIHPSLLPSFPGLHAQKQAVDYGVQFSGCTIHLVDEGVDSGPIILQKAVELSPGETEESLARKIIKMEHENYWRAIARITEGYSIQGRKITFKS